MKRIVILLLSMIMLLLSSCSSDPPINSTVIDDEQRYLQVNKYVDQMLHEHFLGMLPSTDLVNSERSDYHYEYSCSVLGEPSFLIHCTVKFDSAESLSKETGRLNKISNEIYSLKDNRILFYVKPDANNLDRYLDDMINDGLSFCFEMALLDENSNSIEYLTALQQDNQMKSDIIIKFVELIRTEI